jgi:hypothetical protein
MSKFFVGANVMATAVAALFFLRFWVRTRDRLFVMFAAAFSLLGAGWLTLALTQTYEESKPELYLIRLTAFVLIIVAIVDKNRTTRRGTKVTRPPDSV